VLLPQLHKRPKLDPTAGAGRAAQKAFPQGSRSSPLSFNVTPADILVTMVDAPEIVPVRIFYNPVPPNQGHQLCSASSTSNFEGINKI
jgi:hypothetical protein